MAIKRTLPSAAGETGEWSLSDHGRLISTQQSRHEPRWHIWYPWPQALGLVALLAVTCLVESVWLTVGWLVLVWIADLRGARRNLQIPLIVYVLDLVVVTLISGAAGVGVLHLILDQ